MIKYATALRLGSAEAEAILRRFTRQGMQDSTYNALLELGKAVKAIFLCEYLHSLDLRREIQEGLNVVETWKSTNSFIFYGRGSEIATNNRQAQELSVLAMQLLQVSMVYINTLMIREVLAQAAWHNRLEPEDLRALTPLIYAHVNPQRQPHDLVQFVSFGRQHDHMGVRRLTYLAQHFQTIHLRQHDVRDDQVGLESSKRM